MPYCTLKETKCESWFKQKQASREERFDLCFPVSLAGPGYSISTRPTKDSSVRLPREYEGLQCKMRYIYFVKFSGQAAQTVTLMAFCIETQTLKVILTVFYLVLTSEILQTGAGKGKEDFFCRKTHMCKLGVYRVLHWSPSYNGLLKPISRVEMRWTNDLTLSPEGCFCTLACTQHYPGHRVHRAPGHGLCRVVTTQVHVYGTGTTPWTPPNPQTMHPGIALQNLFSSFDLSQN